MIIEFKEPMVSISKSEFDAKIAEAKADAAMEIFEAIQEDCFDQFGYFDYDAFAELKKKYIPQDCRKCKHMPSCEPNVFGICDEYEEKKK